MLFKAMSRLSAILLSTCLYFTNDDDENLDTVVDLLWSLREPKYGKKKNKKKGVGTPKITSGVFLIVVLRYKPFDETDIQVNKKGYGDFVLSMKVNLDHLLENVKTFQKSVGDRRHHSCMTSQSSCSCFMPVMTETRIVQQAPRILF